MKLGKRFRCLLCSTVVLIVFTAGFVSPMRAMELTVSPPRIELNVEPGKPVEGTILLSGSFPTAAVIRVTYGDWSLKPNGDFIFFERPGLQSRSLLGWLEVSPGKFTMSGKQMQTVRYRLRPPEDITGGYWGMIFLQGDPKPVTAGQGSVGVNIVGRLAVIVYAQTQRGAIVDGKIKGVTAKWAEGSLAMTANFVNLGNVMLRLKGRFEIRDAASGKTVDKVNFENLPVLPDGNRIIAMTEKERLAPGAYALVAVVDYGGKSNVAGQCSFKIR